MTYRIPNCYTLSPCSCLPHSRIAEAKQPPALEQLGREGHPLAAEPQVALGSVHNVLTAEALAALGSVDKPWARACKVDEMSECSSMPELATVYDSSDGEY